MLAARAMAFLAAHIPLRHRFRLNVVVDEWLPSHSGPVGISCYRADSDRSTSHWAGRENKRLRPS
jgi:hypothetical protein